MEKCMNTGISKRIKIELFCGEQIPELDELKLEVTERLSISTKLINIVINKIRD